jgi:hypothetical protein
MDVADDMFISVGVDMRGASCDDEEEMPDLLFCVKFTVELAGSYL